MKFPESLERIIESIGVEDAVKLVSAAGGNKIYISWNPGDSNIAYAAIGREKFFILAKNIGPGEYWIPKCDKAIKERRNQAIHADLALGANSTRTVSMKYGITDRHVRNIRKKPVVNNPTAQGDLFG